MKKTFIILSSKINAVGRYESKNPQLLTTMLITVDKRHGLSTIGCVWLWIGGKKTSYQLGIVDNSVDYSLERVP